MVRGARSGSSSGRRSSRRRGLFAPSGSGEFTLPHPRVPVVGPSSMPPSVVAGSGQCTPSPPTVVGPSVSKPPVFLAGASTVPEAEGAVSLQEGGGSFYESTLREVDKIEPAQASQFITRTIQAHFPGPIHRFNDFPMEAQELLYQMFMSNHRFTHRSDEAWSRLVWTTTAQSNFKHLLYSERKNSQKVCQSADPALWRGRTPTWIRRDYWESLCNIWAIERWQQTSTTMKVNRAANLEANMHTSGSISFATHQSRLESYSQQMTEKYAGEEEQPQLDPKTSAFTTPGALDTSPNEMMGFILDTISSLESRLAQTMQMQVSDTVQA
ncbi:hypothetical protein Taro_014703 [Colocasia esculenta]|uniref:Uncharacterized protein n=1 Tax=Colocasia esculenta TaxID=4460 RepID=A0A843UJH4_COLES|nr:hypothetical protein [Colocasia esculenta]